MLANRLAFNCRGARPPSCLDGINRRSRETACSPFKFLPIRIQRPKDGAARTSTSSSSASACHSSGSSCATQRLRASSSVQVVLSLGRSWEACAIFRELHHVRTMSSRVLPSESRHHWLPGQRRQNHRVPRTIRYHTTISRSGIIF